jgi:LacI family transcriptional regulator
MRTAYAGNKRAFLEFLNMAKNSQKSRNIATKPRHIALMLDLEWPYKRHAGIFAGTQQYAQQQGWKSTIDELAHYTLSQIKVSKKGTDSVPSNIPYDGIIARANKQVAEQAKRLGVPLVNVWYSSPVRDSLPGVFPDVSENGRICAEHLLARGLRSFAAVKLRTDKAHFRILKAFCSILVETGYSCAVAEIPLTIADTVAHWEETQQVLTEFMDNWQLPIGVYVCGEIKGRMVVQMCLNRGWRVPEDVAIIAGDNELTLCEYPRPSLTSMELGYERIGYEAAKLLDSLMDGVPPPDEHLLIPPVGLVVRESTDFFAVDDPLVAEAMAFISANSHRRIGPDEVAKAVAAETRTLQLRFRKYLDRPIATEIHRVRIERVKRELTQSKRPLTEIAHDTGFAHAEAMSKVFRRELGISPKEYRKQRQQKPLAEIH